MKFLYDLSSTAYTIESRKKRGGRRGRRWISKENRSATFDEGEDFNDGDYSYEDDNDYNDQDPDADAGAGAGAAAHPGAGFGPVFV